MQKSTAAVLLTKMRVAKAQVSRARVSLEDANVADAAAARAVVASVAAARAVAAAGMAGAAMVAAMATTYARAVTERTADAVAKANADKVSAKALVAAFESERGL